MDFGNAALLIAAVFGLIELVKTLVRGTGAERITVGIVAGCSLVAVFLVGATVWAKEQVIGGQHLDKLGVADKLVVVIFVAGAAAFGKTALEKVSNLGQNPPSKIQQEAFDAVAAKVLTEATAGGPNPPLGPDGKPIAPPPVSDIHP